MGSSFQPAYLYGTLRVALRVAVRGRGKSPNQKPRNSFRGNLLPGNPNLTPEFTFATPDRKILPVWPFSVMFVIGPGAVSHPLPPKAGGINSPNPVPRHGAVARRDAAGARHAGVVRRLNSPRHGRMADRREDLAQDPPPPKTQDPQLVQRLLTRAERPAWCFRMSRSHFPVAIRAESSTAGTCRLCAPRCSWSSSSFCPSLQP